MNSDNQGPEQRLIELSAQLLAGYRAGVVSLKQLVDELETVWHHLPPSERRDDIRGYWWTLEQVYAVALDRNEIDSLSSDALDDINEAVAALQRLLSPNL